MSYPPPSEMSPLVAEIRFDKGSMRRQALPSWDGGRLSSLSGRRQRCLISRRRGPKRFRPCPSGLANLRSEFGKPHAKNRFNSLLLQLRYRSTSTHHAIQPQPPVLNTTQSASSHRTMKETQLGLQHHPLGVMPVQSAVHLMPIVPSIASPRTREPAAKACLFSSFPTLCLIGFSRDSVQSQGMRDYAPLDQLVTSSRSPSSYLNPVRLVMAGPAWGLTCCVRLCSFQLCAHQSD